MRVPFTFCALWLACVSLSVATDKCIIKVICYYGSWAVYRSGDGAITISDLDPTLCTHMIYTFVGLSEDGKVSLLDPWNDLSTDGGKGSIEKFNNLRTLSPSTKTMVAIGGWNEGSERYSDVIGDPKLRSTFVNSIVKFVRTYGFDGVDIDWEYPNQRGGNEDDVKNFVLFLKELSKNLKKRGLILSVAVAAAEESASLSYDIPNIAKYVDFINLMAYDFYGSWSSSIGHNAPLYPASRETTASEQTLNVDAAVRYWLSQGAPAEKLILGTAAYGRSFELADDFETEPGSPIDGPGKAGPYSQEAGTLTYLEILELEAESDWTVVWDEEQHVPYVYRDYQWISYDNVRSITEKAEYAKSAGLGGCMMWSLESDDFRGVYGARYPLLTALNHALNGEISAKAAPSVSTSATTRTSNSVSSSEEDSTAICSSGSTYVRDSNDCSKFWVCQKIRPNGFKATPLFCDDGLFFDVTRNVCNYANSVKCTE